MKVQDSPKGLIWIKVFAFFAPSWTEKHTLVYSVTWSVKCFSSQHLQCGAKLYFGLKHHSKKHDTLKKKHQCVNVLSKNRESNRHNTFVKNKQNCDLKDMTSHLCTGMMHFCKVQRYFNSKTLHSNQTNQHKNKTKKLYLDGTTTTQLFCSNVHRLECHERSTCK